MVEQNPLSLFTQVMDFLLSGKMLVVCVHHALLRVLRAPMQSPMAYKAMLAPSLFWTYWSMSSTSCRRRSLFQHLIQTPPGQMAQFRYHFLTEQVTCNTQVSQALQKTKTAKQGKDPLTCHPVLPGSWTTTLLCVSSYKMLQLVLDPCNAALYLL